MQQPPPVPELLNLLAAFATAVSDHLMAPTIIWDVRPADGEWSLVEVVCHLRDVEKEIHQARFRKLIAQDNAFLPGVDADEWAHSRNYQAADGVQARDEFLAARAETIRLLAALPESVWQHHARHAFFGPTSLRELVFLAVKHDDVHLTQIEKLAAFSRRWQQE